VCQHRPAAPSDPGISAVSLSPTTYRTPHSRHQPTEGRSAQRRCEAANRPGDHPKRSLNGRLVRNQVSAPRSPGQNNIPSTLEPPRARPIPADPPMSPTNPPARKLPVRNWGRAWGSSTTATRAIGAVCPGAGSRERAGAPAGSEVQEWWYAPGISLPEYLGKRLADPAVLHAIATLAFRQAEPPAQRSHQSHHAVPADQPRSEPA
jgi:hypothetical protein